MIIDDIFVKRSPVHASKTWVLHIEIGGFTYSGYFDTFAGFLSAVTDAGGFFAVKMSKARADQVKTTRPLNG